MTRHLDRIAGVWDAIGGCEQADLVGFCLDTCHAHAGGNPLETVVADVLAITGRIDLVHGNDSRDEFDSGADRHANLGAGRIDADLLASVDPRRRRTGRAGDARRGRRARRGHRLAATATLNVHQNSPITGNLVAALRVWVGRELAGHVRGSCPAAFHVGPRHQPIPLPE